MSKKQKSYRVKASAWIDIELKIEASSPLDAYDKLQDREYMRKILDKSGVKLPVLYGISDGRGEYAWDTKGKKPEQYSAYTSAEVAKPL
tara:strand:+ start:314 stop:580 length:267 start_codon:yes stop_codon:yes gene_type:complete